VAHVLSFLVRQSTRAEILIFFLEEGLAADGANGTTGEEVSVCKETLFIRPPAHGKRKSLSVHEDLSSFRQFQLEMGYSL
jgi:hypothetical protein